MLDFVIVADATSSMGEFLSSIPTSIKHVFNIAMLTGAVDRFGVLLYRDYTNVRIHKVTTWSGWLCSDSLSVDLNSLVPGGDEPEAAKTALVELCNYIDKTTIVIWYTDAAPHHESNNIPSHPNFGREQDFLPMFDWLEICRSASSLCRVFPLIAGNDPNITSFYVYLATICKGFCYTLDQNITSELISYQTVQILLAALNMPAKFLANGLVYKTELPPFSAAYPRTERNLKGFLPILVSKKNSHLIVVPPNQIAMIDMSDIKITPVATDLVSMRLVRSNFKTKSTFFDLGCNAMLELCDPSTILMLASNSIFGCVYREICKYKSDGRVRILQNKISDSLNKLSEGDKKTMQDWLEESYYSLDSIEDAINDLEDAQKSPVIILDNASDADRMRPKDLLDLGFSCAPFLVSRITSLVSRFRIIPSGDVSRFDYLPLNLPNQVLFSMISHLICRGLVLSLRPSIVIAAIITAIKHPVLLGRANEYLMECKGEWFNYNYPPNFNIGFLRIATKLDRNLVTNQERESIELIRDINGILINKLTSFSLLIPSKPNKSLRPDRFIECRQCNLKRSFTLIAENGKCGFCLSGKEYISTLNTKPGYSYFCECRTCKSQYAILEPTKLTVEPKCYFCRSGNSVKNLACTQCQSKFISFENITPFICPSCELGKSYTDNVSVTLFQLLDDENNRSIVLSYLEILPDSELDFKSVFNLTAFSLRHKFKRAKQNPTSSNIFFNGYTVLNTPSVLESIRTWVHSSSAELGMCSMCCMDIKKQNLSPACGRHGCDTKCCSECLSTWYGVAKPGHRLPLTNLTCPFCKRLPTAKELQKYNAQICTINMNAGIRRILSDGGFEGLWYYAWCLQCYSPKEYMEKVCAMEPPETSTFQCADCLLNSSNSVRARECPKCSTMVEKLNGCDHITCTCRCHWCYRCGTAFEEATIYSHIWTCPGDGVIAENYGNLGDEDFDEIEDYNEDV